MHCVNVNHYANNWPKTNQKTLLRKMVINNKKTTTIKPAVLLKIISLVNLKNL